MKTYTVKELLGMEDRFGAMIGSLSKKMILFSKGNLDSSTVVIPLLKEEGSPEFSFYIYRRDPLTRLLRGQPILDDKSSAVKATVHIPYYGHYVLSITKEDVKRGYVPEEEIADTANKLVHQYALSMASYFLIMSGYLDTTLKSIDNREFKEIEEQYDEMLSISHHQYGYNITLWDVENRMMYNKYEEDTFGVITPLTGDGSQYIHALTSQIVACLKYGWAFGGQYTIWKAPINQTFKKEEV